MLDAKLQKKLRDAAFSIDLTNWALMSYVDDGTPRIIASWRGLRVSRIVKPDESIGQAEEDAIANLNTLAASMFLDLLSRIQLKGE